MQADMAPGHSSGLDVNIAQVSAQAIPVCMVLGNSVTLGHQQGLRCWPRPQVSALPSGVTRATDIDTDLSCGRAMNPDNDS